MSVKFFITGCHGDLAYSIAKIIRENFKKAKIIGSDIEKNGIGNNIFDKIYKIPKLGKKNYHETILKISKQADLIIPATEKEIVYFTKNKNKFKNKILVNDKQVINLFTNKLSTQAFLRKNFQDMSLKFNFKLENFFKLKKKPKRFFLKKLSGSGNQNYKIIKNKSDLESLKFYKKKDWVIEQLWDKGDEFTCAIIKLKNFEKIIILKRKLHKFGHTMFAETFNNLRIEKKLLKIANKINLHGSINIQFRIQNNNIKIFDINPRLSSTIKMRDLIGFKDCLWWINDKLGLKNKDKIKIDKDKLLIKYFNENIISTTKTKKLKFLLKVPRNKDIHFLFNLYNQNVLEKKFFSLKKVSFKEHKTWFNNKIKGKMFYISLIDNKKLGYVRFDKIDEKNLSVSIAIKKEFQRRGYGKKMLSKILNKKELKKYNIWAYTLSKNIASKKFFLNLGFKSFKDNQFVKQSKIS